MIKAIINDTKFRFAIALVLFLSIFSVLMGNDGFTPIESVRIVLGGSPLGIDILGIAFSAYIAMLMYINIDAINYLSLNNACLVVRYNDKKKILKKLISTIIILNIMIMFVILIAVNIAIILLGTDYRISIPVTAELFFRGTLSGVFCSVLHIIIITLFNNTNAFMIIIGLTIAYTFLSCLGLDAALVFPFELSGIMLAVNIVISCIYTLIIILICYKIYKRKGVF